MAKVTPITEHFQHFVRDLKESFWGLAEPKPTYTLLPFTHTSLRHPSRGIVFVPASVVR
jgi:hypothetical protein